MYQDYNIYKNSETTETVERPISRCNMQHVSPFKLPVIVISTAYTVQSLEEINLSVYMLTSMQAAIDRLRPEFRQGKAA